MSGKYTVIISQEAHSDISEIYSYIALSLREPGYCRQADG